MSGEPYPKSSQLARGDRRYRRKVASPKQWQAIIAAKIGPCRVCVHIDSNGSMGPRLVHFHHLVPRSMGGDDVRDNIVPLCAPHHDLVTFSPGCVSSRALRDSLTDAEYAYVIGKLGEGGIERLFGVGSR